MFGKRIKDIIRRVRGKAAPTQRPVNLPVVPRYHPPRKRQTTSAGLGNSGRLQLAPIPVRIRR